MLGLFHRCISESLPAATRQAVPFSAVNSTACLTELQKQIETGLKVRNDVWRAGVSRVAQGASPMFGNLLVEPSSCLLVAASQPFDEGAHCFGVEASLCISLALGESTDFNAAF